VVVECAENVEVVNDRVEDEVEATEDDNGATDGVVCRAEREETTDESPDATVNDLRLAIFADAAVDVVEAEVPVAVGDFNDEEEGEEVPRVKRRSSVLGSPTDQSTSKTVER